MTHNISLDFLNISCVKQVFWSSGSNQRIALTRTIYYFDRDLCIHPFHICHWMKKGTDLGCQSLASPSPSPWVELLTNNLSRIARFGPTQNTTYAKKVWTHPPHLQRKHLCKMTNIWVRGLSKGCYVYFIQQFKTA